MNSWDCFDTLIGRSFMTPVSIFNIVGEKIKDPSFVQKRITAEKLSKYKTYEDIYKNLPSYDPEIETQTEKEYSFPILENWNAVKDGDCIISDMYLSKKQIYELLEYHNLNKNVDIIVSYSGKHSGESWNKLKSRFPKVEKHYGDNIRSDVIVARQNHINSVFYSGSSFTPDEKIVSSYDHQLACLMRRVRLSNPFPRTHSKYIHNNGSIQNIAGHVWREEINGYVQNYFIMKEHTDKHIILERIKNKCWIKINFDGTSLYSDDNTNYTHLYNGEWIEENTEGVKSYQKLIWSDQSQYNIPLLLSIASFLPKNKKIIFSQRDCFYLYLLYRAISNNSECYMLDVSRRSYYNPYNIEYINHIRKLVTDSLIVDSHGSGSSANYFFKTYNIPFELYHIFKHPVKMGLVDSNSMSYSVMCNRSFNCYGRFFEKHNINYIGELMGWNNGESIRAHPEHDETACKTIYQCIDNTISYINQYKNIAYNESLVYRISNNLKQTFTEQFVQSIGK